MQLVGITPVQRTPPATAASYVSQAGAQRRAAAVFMRAQSSAMPQTGLWAEPLGLQRRSQNADGDTLQTGGLRSFMQLMRERNVNRDGDAFIKSRADEKETALLPYTKQSLLGGATGGKAGAESAAAAAQGAQKKEPLPEPKGPCPTCESRRYQDKSTDIGVSFSSPTKVSPHAAGGAVMSHEREHVRNAQERADEAGGRLISNVRVKTSICPDCGRVYVSGGVAEVTIVKGKKSGGEQKAG